MTNGDFLRFTLYRRTKDRQSDVDDDIAKQYHVVEHILCGTAALSSKPPIDDIIR